MLKIKKISTLALLISAVIATTACNDKEKTETAQAQTATQNAGDVKDPSYAVGALFGTDLKGVVEAQKGVVEYDQEKLLAGVKDALNGKVDLTNPDLASTLKGLDEKLRTASQAKATEQVQKAKTDGEKLVAEFKKKDGVKETKSGLLYRIEKAGEGDTIKATDIVKVHYTGKLPDGTVFDTSLTRGKPAEFALNQVIPGWTEGLQLVKKGAKMELVIPPALAYGEQDLGTIPANSTLYFEVEVLDVKPTK
ncbi:peptidylprolyl isomerase [Pasteurellaceae bacterium Pebbles2]|nr:peptidylprolyl isomerase [Pasteurellaceae bacterium Pebbles2]